jgi:hypothetical protein
MFKLTLAVVSFRFLPYTKTVLRTQIPLLTGDFKVRQSKHWLQFQKKISLRAQMPELTGGCLPLAEIPVEVSFKSGNYTAYRSFLQKRNILHCGSRTAASVHRQL